MIRKMETGGYVVTGLAIPPERVAALLGEDNGLGIGGVLVAGREIDQLIQARADEMLATMIEHQRHALLPEQRVEA